jgi:dual oxidase
VKEWTEINPTLFKKRPELLRLLAGVYANRLDNVDLYVGGMLESRDGPAELFRAIIKEQFTCIRDAYRFWFENTESG